MKLAAFMSDEVADPRSCPKCNAALENKRESYLVDVKLRRGSESSMIGCNGGWFCPRCPTVVLDSRVFRDMISAPIFRSRRTDYTVLGFVDLDAVPKSKEHIPLGEKGNPIPLVEFGYASTELKEPEKPRLPNPKRAKSNKLTRAISKGLRAIVSQKPKPAKVGRNDPCPCGSGKKYKKCCMRKSRR